jgi:hypothetical protein
MQKRKAFCLRGERRGKNTSPLFSNAFGEGHVRRAARQRSAGAAVERRRGGLATKREDRLPSDVERGGRVFLLCNADLLRLPFLVIFLASRVGESWHGAGRHRFLLLRPARRRTRPPVLRHHAGGGRGHLHLPLLLHCSPLSSICQSACEETRRRRDPAPLFLPDVAALCSPPPATAGLPLFWRVVA